MAKRASETFHTCAGQKSGKATFSKDQVVPAAVAKLLPGLVYDDGAKSIPAAKD